VFRLEKRSQFQIMPKHVNYFEVYSLYYKLQLCFKHHLHCIKSTYHKGFRNINKFNFLFCGGKDQIINSLNLECCLCAFNSPLLVQNNSTSKSLYIMKIKGPFLKLVMLEHMFNCKGPLFKSKLKINRSNGSI